MGVEREQPSKGAQINFFTCSEVREHGNLSSLFTHTICIIYNKNILSLRVVLVLPEGIKVNAGVLVGGGGV